MFDFGSQHLEIFFLPVVPTEHLDQFRQPQIPTTLHTVIFKHVFAEIHKVNPGIPRIPL